MSQQVIIFDTTLRDGEQALQASLSVKEKLQIALALERMGVDVMEVGFPVSSPGDFESVQTIARTIKNSRVCGLARCVEKDIDVAAESLKVAEAFRIHTFIATSPMHIATKLRSTLDEVIERAVYMVKRARNYTCRLNSPTSLPACMSAYLTLIKQSSQYIPMMIWAWP